MASKQEQCRQPIDGGGWFDLGAATAFKESQHFDGRNMISDATHSQWEHEKLYRTKRGTYVLHAWSQWQGSGESWQRLEVTEAADWLVRNGHDLETVAEPAAAAEAEV